MIACINYLLGLNQHQGGGAWAHDLARSALPKRRPSGATETVSFLFAWWRVACRFCSRLHSETCVGGRTGCSPQVPALAVTHSAG